MKEGEILRVNIMKANTGKRINVRKVMEGKGGYIQQAKELKADRSRIRTKTKSKNSTKTRG